MAGVFCAVLATLLVVVPTDSRISSAGCSLNGTVYGEGSAMVTSSHCEYCYCIKGKQHCVRPHCILDVPGCKPVYNKHSCCPVKYHCSDINTTATSTTTASTKINDSGGNCNINGTTYQEGDRIDGIGDQCENCYCMKSEVRCEATVCPAPLDICTPIISPGHCCPTSYNCSNEESSTAYNGKDDEITTESSGTSPPVAGSTYGQDSDITTLDTTTEVTTFETPTIDTELRSVTGSDQLNDESSTVQATHPDLSTTITSESTDHPTKSSTYPVRSIPDVLEEILNRTLAKDEDYEYDYNESSLPPSLPNLKIIPFVAADAVLNEQNAYSTRLEGKTEIPIYLDAPKPSRFSPPSKTEGGFVPRDPIIDGPFYETKFGKPFTNEREPQVELTSEMLLPPITEPPKFFEEGKCEKGGITFHHGEVVSKANPCELCVCYYKEIHCQKPKCNPIKPGCHRIEVKESCCGKEICDENPPRISELQESTSSTTALLETMSNIPAITVADLIATPNPFRDVIRTEPAPPLVDIMKDLLPHLVSNSTSTTREPEVTKHHHGTDSKITTNISDLTSENAKNKSHNILNSTTESIQGNLTKIKESENPSTESESYNNSFSFSSVLDFLFRSEEPSEKTEKHHSSTTESPHTQTYTNIYNKKKSGQKQDINNAIENMESDYYAQKNKAQEKTNERLIFHDYQADEVRNDTKDSSNKDKIESKIDSNKRTENRDIGNKTINEDIRSGLLKLAGCNIYGRMYRVGRIIAELSGPCLECMCTEFGVQCRKLCS